MPTFIIKGTTCVRRTNFFAAINYLMKGTMPPQGAKRALIQAHRWMSPMESANVNLRASTRAQCAAS